MARGTRKQKADAPAGDERNNFDTVDRGLQELFYHHKRRLITLEAEAQTASRALSAGRKRAKEELGDTALDDIKESRRWDKKGGEGAVKAAFERLARLARWAGFSTGVQGELFRDAPKQITPFERGRLAGLNGDERDSPYDAGSSEEHDFMAGYDDGQQAIFKIQRAKDADEFEADAESGDGEGDDGAGDDTNDDGDEDETTSPPAIGDQESTAQVTH